MPPYTKVHMYPNSSNSARECVPYMFPYFFKYAADVSLLFPLKK